MVSDTLNAYRFVFGQSEAELKGNVKIVDTMPKCVTSITVVKGVSPVVITFTVTPVSTTVAVEDSSGTAVNPGSDGAYSLVKDQEYSYTASAKGYITQSETFKADQSRTISIALTAEGGTSNPGTGNMNAPVWDGKSIDVSWFDKNSYDSTDSYYIGTPAQRAGRKQHEHRHLSLWSVRFQRQDNLPHRRYRHGKGKLHAHRRPVSDEG